MKTENETDTIQLVDFDCTLEESQMIDAITERVMARKQGIDPISLQMDMIAVHKYCVPLDFKKLLAFDDFNFMHDVMGIHNLLVRSNFVDQIRLDKHFIPRCHAKV